MAYRLTINGVQQEFDVDADTPLLWVIREQGQLLGTKFGCGMGLCGACTIHVNGEATRACVTPISSAENQSITTIEGLSTDGEHPVQQAWKKHQVPQCGYCQSGQIMNASAFLAKNSQPSETEILNAMSGNICRCGTYPNIKKAIQSASEAINSSSVAIEPGENNG